MISLLTMTIGTSGYLESYCGTEAWQRAARDACNAGSQTFPLGFVFSERLSTAYMHESMGTNGRNYSDCRHGDSAGSQTCFDCGNGGGTLAMLSSAAWPRTHCNDLLFGLLSRDSLCSRVWYVCVAPFRSRTLCNDHRSASSPLHLASLGDFTTTNY